MLGVFTNIKNGHNVDVPDVKPKENNLKYDKLLKEHELLKEKFETAVKELTNEKEKKKAQSNVKVEDTKNVDLQNSKLHSFYNLEFTKEEGDRTCIQCRKSVTAKKKLEEALALRETERKAWEKEKLALSEEKDKLKSKLLSLSAEKLKVYNEVVQLKKDLGKT